MRALRVLAAGSLKRAVGDIADEFSAVTGVPVEADFAASGVLRRRIEAGEAVDIFASANRDHPARLAATGTFESPLPFARNWMCALLRPGLEVDARGLLDAMLDPAVKLGTSTPAFDPSGDYADTVFDRADTLSPGAGGRLKDKALRLTGAPGIAKPADDRNTYAWLLETGQADVFLTYVTNARLARNELAGAVILPLPAAMAVAADFHLAVARDAPASARRLAERICGADGRSVLRRYGFDPPALATLDL